MEKQKSNYGFEHNGHMWHHMNPGQEEEIYRLYAGQDLVVQAWPTEEKVSKGYTLATKDYSNQVWHQKKNIPLNDVLDKGGNYADLYLEQVAEHGPPKRLPPYLYKEQYGDYVWTIDSREVEGAELLQYIEEENGDKVVEIAHIDEGSGEPVFYVSLMHSEAEEGAAPFRTHELQEAFDYGEKKANEYYGQLSKDDLKNSSPGEKNSSDIPSDPQVWEYWYEKWKAEDNFWPDEAKDWSPEVREGYDQWMKSKAEEAALEHFIEEPYQHNQFKWMHGRNKLGQEYYLLTVDNEDLVQIEANDPGRQIDFYSNAYVSYADARSGKWEREFNLTLEDALDFGENRTNEYLNYRKEQLKILEYNLDKINDELSFPGSDNIDNAEINNDIVDDPEIEME